MASVAVVILNYNGVGYLEQFLPSVVQHSSDAEIIIADNASTDHSIEFLEKNYPGLRVIQLEKNLGYAGGYNLALKDINYDYSILLNSDIEVTPNWIHPIINYMEAHAGVVACQPKILDYQNKEKFEYAGAAGGFIDYMGYPYCRGRILDELEIDHGQYDEISDIHWATGACMFVRTSSFKDAGGFDDDFFAHMEEIDLCWRFRLMGHSLKCIPESKIYHVGGGTLNKLNPRKTYLNFRNNLSLLLKNETASRLVWQLPFKVLLDWAAACKFALDNSWSHSWAILRAQMAFVILISKNLKKRALISRNKKINLQNSNFLLPFQYFIKGKKTFDQIHQHP
ncbi:MAG: glycosyltransferase family 2 protein [Reichenbachiella sp.]|uniref:glycosyltransferase family 2 protein n=1 Tax=Reichenbachiella sp. TaxID=2184521 RepID=UPI0032671515